MLSVITKSFHFILDYVAQIWDNICHQSKETLSKTAEKYKKLCPQPLANMFPDRLSKKEAIERRKSRENIYQTKLEPSGKNI